MRHDIRNAINKADMSTFQVVAIAICIVLNMLDGFDVLAMAFTASHISAEWQLNGKQVGVLLSAGLLAWQPARFSWRHGRIALGAGQSYCFAW